MYQIIKIITKTKEKPSRERTKRKRTSKDSQKEKNAPRSEKIGVFSAMQNESGKWGKSAQFWGIKNILTNHLTRYKK